MSSQRELGLLSVAAPTYNEELTVREFHRRISESLAGKPFELILVDDGSTDGTPQLLE